MSGRVNIPPRLICDWMIEFYSYEEAVFIRKYSSKVRGVRGTKETRG